MLIYHKKTTNNSIILLVGRMCGPNVIEKIIISIITLFISRSCVITLAEGDATHRQRKTLRDDSLNAGKKFYINFKLFLRPIVS